MEAIMNSLIYSNSDYKFLAWLKNHTKLMTWINGLTYTKGCIVVINKSIYRSLIDNNTSNPLDNNNNWIKLL